jgi:putative transposase
MLLFLMANYKRLFLNGYSYYITIITHQRNPILIENIELLRESFKYAKSLFSFHIEEIVIMPEHLHMIIEVKYAKDYPKIISSMKRYFSKNCPKKYYNHILQSHHREKMGYLPVWQKRFYEHTIRDEKDWITKVQYIHNNPVKHGLVENIHHWKYGSLNFKQKNQT